MFCSCWSSFYYAAPNSGLGKIHKGVSGSSNHTSSEFTSVQGPGAWLGKQPGHWWVLWNWKLQLILHTASSMQLQRLLKVQHSSQGTAKVKLCEVVWLILGVFFWGTAETDRLDGFHLCLTSIAKSQGRRSSCPSFFLVSISVYLHQR